MEETTSCSACMTAILHLPAPQVPYLQMGVLQAYHPWFPHSIKTNCLCIRRYVYASRGQRSLSTLYLRQGLSTLKTKHRAPDPQSLPPQVWDYFFVPQLYFVCVYFACMYVWGQAVITGAHVLACVCVHARPVLSGQPWLSWNACSPTSVFKCWDLRCAPPCPSLVTFLISHLFCLCVGCVHSMRSSSEHSRHGNSSGFPEATALGFSAVPGTKLESSWFYGQQLPSCAPSGCCVDSPDCLMDGRALC